MEHDCGKLSFLRGRLEGTGTVFIRHVIPVKETEVKDKSLETIKTKNK